MVNKMQIYKLRYADASRAAEKIKPILKSFYIQQIISNKNKNKKLSTNIVQNDNNTTKAKKDFELSALDHSHLVLTYKDQKIKNFTTILVSSMDHIKKQITVYCKIYEINTNFLNKKGIRLEALGETVNKALNLSMQIAGEYPSVISSTNNRLRVNTILSLLNNKDNSTLIATPKVTLIEGSTANLKDGKTYPITTEQTTTTNSSTSNTIQKTKYVDIGLLFTIKYDYAQSKYHYIDIALNQKNLLDYNANKKTLVTTNREIMTNIRIIPGETIIIAGVGSDELKKKEVKVPYLSQIPLLGELLKYKYKQHDKTTIVMTVRIEDGKNKRIIRSLYAKPGSNKTGLRIKTK